MEKSDFLAGSHQDSTDDFEMKPLTRGLGFHKSKNPVSVLLNIEKPEEDVSASSSDLHSHRSSESRQSSQENQTHPSESIADLLAHLKSGEDAPLPMPQKATLKIKDPLPRQGDDRQAKRSAEIRKAQDTERINELFKKPNFPTSSDLEIPPPPPHLRQENWGQAKRFEKTKMNVGVRRGAADAPQKHWIPGVFSLPAAFLDAASVLGMTMIFLVPLLMVTEVNLISVLTHAKVDLTTQMSLVVLYLAVMEIYVVLTRSFFGRTLGEWTFDYQLGSEADQKRGTYPLRVIWRSFVIALTGFIVLPLLSSLVRKDLTSYLCGVEVYKKSKG